MGKGRGAVKGSRRKKRDDKRTAVLRPPMNWTLSPAAQTLRATRSAWPRRPPWSPLPACCRAPGSWCVCSSPPFRVPLLPMCEGSAPIRFGHSEPQELVGPGTSYVQMKERVLSSRRRSNNANAGRPPSPVYQARGEDRGLSLLFESDPFPPRASRLQPRPPSPVKLPYVAGELRVPMPGSGFLGISGSGILSRSPSQHATVLGPAAGNKGRMAVSAAARGARVRSALPAVSCAKQPAARLPPQLSLPQQIEVPELDAWDAGPVGPVSARERVVTDPGRSPKPLPASPSVLRRADKSLSGTPSAALKPHVFQ